MIPAPFEYARAESVDHAIELLGSSEDAKILAGGHSLLPLMKVRFAQPSLLVDIGRIGDLSYVREDDDVIAIGALTRHQDVANSELLQASCPIVADAAGQIGDPQVRHMGTIGGAVAHSDPASDMPTVMLALGAQMVVRSAGRRSRGRWRPPTSSRGCSRPTCSPTRCWSRCACRRPPVAGAT